MATVKMGQIKSTPAKALAYIARGSATMDGLYVSTNAAVIDPSDHVAVARAMGETSRAVGRSVPRAGSVLAHHVIQSFDPSETVDPEVAHQLGRELAERITGGQHEYMIATHLDTQHVHNHIIFNAVNMETGRKFRCQKDTIGRIRWESDELCRGAGLAVLPPLERRTATRGFGQIYATIRGESHLHRIRTEVDRAAAVAHSWDEFEGRLREAQIEVSRSRGQVSFRAEEAPRAVRAWRLGPPYEESALVSRLARSEVNRIDVDQKLIASVDDKSVRVIVPGTKGQYLMTVPKEHIIQHGRTLRCYVPSASDIVLSNRSGRYQRAVPTTELYRWFSVPKESLMRANAVARRPLVGSVSFEDLRTWRQAAVAMHQLGDRMNATVRWVSKGDVSDGLRRAQEQLSEVHSEFSARLVAFTEVLDQPRERQEVRELEVMAAELRSLNRELGKLRRDVSVLESMQQGDQEVGMQKRIQAMAAARADERGAGYGGKQAVTARQEERNATEREDLRQDREVIAEEQRDGMRLADRIAARAQEIRTERAQTRGEDEARGPRWRQ